MKREVWKQRNEVRRERVEGSNGKKEGWKTRGDGVKGRCGKGMLCGDDNGRRRKRDVMNDRKIGCCGEWGLDISITHV